MRGSEGNAVVTADVGRQATLLKQPLKDCESVVLSGRRKRFTGEEKTAGVIGDSERITVLASPVRTRLCNRYTRAHWVAGPAIRVCRAPDDARDRAARPDHADRARHGWCFWREGECRRIYGASAREFCEHPNWGAHA